MAKDVDFEIVFESRMRNDGFYKDVDNLIKNTEKGIDDLSKYLSGSLDSLPSNWFKKTKFQFMELTKIGKDFYATIYKTRKKGDSRVVSSVKTSKISALDLINMKGPKKTPILGYDLAELQSEASLAKARRLEEKEQEKALKEQEKIQKQQRKEAEKLAREEAKSNKETKKRSKILERFKSYGLLRIVRTIFMSIERGIKEGIQQLALFDKSANKTLSSLSSSSEKLKASFAVSFMPVLEMVAPIFENISNSVVSIANEISKASSASKGLAEYTAVSNEYIKDYASTINKVLTSFDKFETINGSGNPLVSKTMTPEEMEQAKSSSAVSTLETVRSIINTVTKIFSMIWNEIKRIWDIIEPDIDNILAGLQKIIRFLGDVFIWMLDLIASLGTLNLEWEDLKLVLLGILGIWLSLKGINAINNITKLLDPLSRLSKSLKTIKTGLIGVTSALGAFTLFHSLLSQLEGSDKMIMSLVVAIAGLVVVIMMMKRALAGDIIGTIAVGIGAGALVAGVVGAVNSAKEEVGEYALGGSPRKGDLFIANERGPELVYSGHGGSSQVANVAQFKQAMVEALYEASDVFQQYDGAVELSLDGAVIARSKRFKSELNRTNPKLNLK